jgi:hypothetical protein
MSHSFKTVNALKKRLSLFVRKTTTSISVTQFGVKPAPAPSLVDGTRAECVFLTVFVRQLWRHISREAMKKRLSTAKKTMVTPAVRALWMRAQPVRCTPET